MRSSKKCFNKKKITNNISNMITFSKKYYKDKGGSSSKSMPRVRFNTNEFMHVDDTTFSLDFNIDNKYSVRP